MQRVSTLLEKIKELNQKGDHSLIEIDLMLDYTRVLYADLQEWRNKTAFTQAHTIPTEPADMQAAEPEPESIPIYTAPAPPPKITQDFASAANEPAASIPALPRGKNIRTLISINDKYQFISELFGNDREAYDEVINAINTFEDEEQALAWIHQNVNGRYGWDDENETLATFYRVLSVFFSER